MKMVVLIGEQSALLKKLRACIPSEYSVLDAPMNVNTLQLLPNFPAGIIILLVNGVDAQAWLDKARSIRPDLTYVELTEPNNSPKQSLTDCYEYIPYPINDDQVKLVLNRASERTELLQNAQLADKRDLPAPNLAPERPTRFSAVEETVLCELSRMLTNNFNRGKLLELFLDAVNQLIPVGKKSVFLLDEHNENFRVAIQRGLDPEFCAQLKFSPTSGIMAWLHKQGRILWVGNNGMKPDIDSGALQEMQLIQAVVSIPFFVNGRLIGSLNLGPKVAGAYYSEDELETLYVLSANIATALQDIHIYHQLKYQKQFTENILQCMNSGVIAIDGNDRVITFNEQAGRILNMCPEEILGGDLRLLPSPLGDLLYGTFSAGKIYDKEEFQMAQGNLPIEISTYPLSGEERTLGSVMVFNDLSARKRFEQESRRADQLEVLNRFVGQLAHEIKNPMVAIQTFSELLPEKYQEKSFRDFFTDTVQKEINRLNELVEQLIAFSTPLSYKYDTITVTEPVNDAVRLLEEQGLDLAVKLENHFQQEAYLYADKRLLTRAFSYLISSFSLDNETKAINIEISPAAEHIIGGEVQIKIWDTETPQRNADIEKLFDPLSAKQDSHISLKLPVGRKIIEDHGGQINAEINKKHNLLFCVQLPRMDEGGEEIDRRAEPNFGSGR